MTCRQLNDERELMIVSRIYRETITRLEIYSRRVAEGRDLEAALIFAQHVLWSDIVGLCNLHARRKTPVIDGAHLKWMAEELQRQVRSWWTDTGKQQTIEMTLLERVSRNLDLIAARVARL